MKLNLFADKKFYLILFWLLFTTIFAVWWMILGLGHVELLAKLLPQQETQWIAQRRMLFWEGLTWITLLLIGGFTALYFLMREIGHLENLKRFFASFNHDVKTSLASLRLQAESLKEDLEADGSKSALLDRLISDTMRLQVQLENSLYMSSKESQKLLLTDVSLSRVLTSAKLRWPQIEIKVTGDATVSADETAMTTLINNLVQNSIVHGSARALAFTIVKSGRLVEIHFEDDGIGFKGDVEKLGSLFHRPTSKSGTGMGLFICFDLTQKMGGMFEILTMNSKGFSGKIQLQGATR